MNRLTEATSPYLLQHAANPVDWYQWGDDAFAAAKSRNLPVLLSVGYAACHWCHVMAHESFEDPAIAALMNRLFINIKLDREERPDLDLIYQNALAMLGQQGGWPLTMFLRPDGTPFWGGTYFPPVARWGRTGFPEILTRISDLYHYDSDKITSNAEALRSALQDLAGGRTGSVPNAEDLGQIARNVGLAFDPQHGGLAGAPKFPQAALFELITRAGLKSGEAAFIDEAILTARHLVQGGIYDHLGGGFARYSTDDRWLVPHFEKMLYDNALLLRWLTLIWQITRDPLFAIRIAETIDFMLTEMRLDEGGFAASFDADSEGEEGRYYVWQQDEITALLGAEAENFCRQYDVTAGGNWEGGNILNRLGFIGPDPDATDPALAAARAQVLAHRRTRIAPARDDKLLVDWNALMISALVEAANVFDRPEWLTAAETAFAFIRDTLWDGETLKHSYRNRTANHAGMLEDYANLAEAALLLFSATGHANYLNIAERLVVAIKQQFSDPAGGGYFMSGVEQTDLIVRPKSILDGATPSGNAVMIGVFARLYALTGKSEYYTSGEAIITGFAGDLHRNTLAMATFVNSIELFLAPDSLLLITTADDDGNALRRAAYQLPLPNRIFATIRPGDMLPPNHPAYNKVTASSTALLYWCRGPVCHQPVATAAALTDLFYQLTGRNENERI